jgi:apolipoprotein D and lipocalin family protein
MKMCGPLLLAILMTVVPPVKAQTLPNQPVSQLDLSRYLGKWHEIAHLPLFFQRQCQDRITATYSRLGHDQIQVLNTCRTKDGVIDAAEGVARPRREGGPGALEVRFAPGWLSWLPWVWADYWVVEIDPDYQWAVVGSPSCKYLWVLSRSPSMRQAQFDAIRDRAAARGYPVAKLMVTAPLD